MLALLADELKKRRAKLFPPCGAFKLLLNMTELELNTLITALLVLSEGIELDISTELAHLGALKAILRVVKPSELFSKGEVKKVPEVLLGIRPEKLEDMQASACGKIEISSRKRLVHTALHKKFLYFKIYLGYLRVVFLEKPCAGLLGINSVVDKHLGKLSDTLGKRKGYDGEVHILKHFNLG